MQIPKKINPDNLRQSFIDIRFDSHIPFELIAGQIFGGLIKSGFKYLPGSNGVINLNSAQGSPNIQVAQSVPGLFFNDKISLRIPEPGRLLFNLHGSYPGWEGYFESLKSALVVINELNIISSYRNIGVRYISEYVNETLSGKIRSNLRWDIEGKDNLIRSSVYKAEYDDVDRRVIVNLADNLKRKNNSNGVIETISAIDVDVIRPLSNTSDINFVIGEIDKSHSLGKEYFFGLLDEKFLSSLNPSY